MTTINPVLPVVGGDVDVWGTVANAVFTAIINELNAKDSALLTSRGLYVGINAQTGTTYAPILADQGKLVTLSNTGAITVTLPSDATTAFPVGTQIDFVAINTGLPTFVAGSGATLNGTPSLVARARWSGVTLVKYAANTWIAIGDLA